MPVYKDAGGRFLFKCSIHGKQYLRRGYKDKASASDAEILFRSSFITGSASSLPTFSVLCDSFLGWYSKRVKESTLFGVRKKIRDWIKGRIPDVRVDLLTIGELDSWRHSLLGHKKSVIEACYSCLKMVFDFCQDYYGFNCRAFRLLPPIRDYSIKPSEPKRKILSSDDFTKFLNSVDDEEAYLLFLTGYLTGLRIGEIRALQPGCLKDPYLLVYQQAVNIGRGESVITSPKSATSNRRVIIPPFLVEMLDSFIRKNQLKKSDFIFFSFSSKSKPVSETSVNRWLTKYSDKSGVLRFNFHMFRHTEATVLIDSGMDKKVVASFLGHSSSKVTEEYYLHQDESDLKEIGDFLEKRFSAFKR